MSMTQGTGPARSGPERIDPGLRGILRCPITGEELEDGDAAAPVLISRGAALAYPVRDGVPILLPHEGRPLPA
nr:Trm112 family protein [Actinomyces bowdenii]